MLDPTRPAPPSGGRIRRMRNALLRPRPLGVAHLARLLARHRPRCRRDAPSRVRPAGDAVRARLARDVLYDRDGALADATGEQNGETHLTQTDPRLDEFDGAGGLVASD